MPQIINTNVMSLNAQRNLNASQNALQTAMQRLSSGLRINSAKDDAAGMAISERMTTQIRGLNQAVRNANDGVSLAQTGEGALAEITSNLQRIRELAVQAANATNSAGDRAALDLEVQQRIAEIERIATQTSFNGQKLLDGTFGSAVFQVGANVGDTIGLNLATSMRSTAIGAFAQGTSSTEVSTAALPGTGTIQVGSGTAVTIGQSVAGSANGQSAGSAFAKANAINSANVSGLTATATNTIALQIANTSSGAGQTYSLRINGIDIFNGTDLSSGALTTQQITDAINAQQNNTGVTAILNGSNLLLTAADGRDIAIGQTLGGGATGGISAGSGNIALNGVTYYQGTIGAFADATNNSTNATAVNGGRLTLTASENIIITGDGAALGFASANFTISKDSGSISQIDVKTVANANTAIYRVDSALTAVSNLRSTFGAIQSRFEAVVSNLQINAENLTASRSRIQDADFAAETAALSRAQILQQAGTAMVAQANQMPQGVLALLR
ncbi:flagellin [Tepidimonas aquatica]|uniref:Flagellin n=1 Tax=Tepidimonas aquatica TaxID=247482 RepID=A0A554WNM2_9BURK|nr:flagellin [Tepidimonas aquatica]TSE25169.1 B-type flagellin [Tepidimonas aquatica]